MGFQNSIILCCGALNEAKLVFKNHYCAGTWTILLSTFLKKHAAETQLDKCYVAK